MLRLRATTPSIRIRPLEVSKANTGLQIGLVGMVLGLDAAGLGLAPLRAAMVGLVTASTLISGGAYVAVVARTP